MYLPKTNSELRRDARAQLKGKWGIAILGLIIYTVLSSIPSALANTSSESVALTGIIIMFIISAPLSLGFIGFFMKIKRGEEAAIENLFDGFRSFLPAFLTYFLVIIFTYLWSLLLVIPGIIKALSYSQAMYILNDNPNIKALEAITLSRRMMDGYKGKYFLMQLSFFGWAILCIFTLFIGYLWLIPYMQTANANFYDDVRMAYEGRQGLYDSYSEN